MIGICVMKITLAQMISVVTVIRTDTTIDHEVIILERCLIRTDTSDHSQKVVMITIIKWSLPTRPDAADTHLSESCYQLQGGSYVTPKKSDTTCK